ncbi:hypothetical protein, partial [Thioclava sp.]|uniref:hypothetical protein n=1 Tax=Thioclava sp. TaxID=1933450 RepID=UPI003242C120
RRVFGAIGIVAIQRRHEGGVACALVRPQRWRGLCTILKTKKAREDTTVSSAGFLCRTDGHHWPSI